jgi:signal transduction histidine kinase
MIERVDKKGVLITSLLFALIAGLVSLQELPTLQLSSQLYLYIGGKVLFICSFLTCIALACLDIGFIFTSFPLIFFVLALFYECHGQCFKANYWLAYIQVTTLFPFIFNVHKRLLLVLLILKLISFDTVLFLTSAQYISKGKFTQEFLNDILSGTLISTIIAYTGASVFLAEKTKRHKMYQRFIDLGKNVSFIVHDIKGLISGPCTYSDILEDKMKAGAITDQEVELVQYLKEDIYSIRDLVVEMNLLVSSHITEKETSIKVSELIQSIRKVFRSKIKNIKIDVVGDMELNVKADYLNRVLTNSIINSCEAIHRKKVQNGRILVYCEDNLLGIADNSGENLTKDILKQLNNPNVSFTTRKEGSGIGILLIKDYIHALGGTFRYSNHVNGVELKITFPRKRLIKSIAPIKPDVRYP